MTSAERLLTEPLVEAFDEHLGRAASYQAQLTNTGHRQQHR